MKTDCKGFSLVEMMIAIVVFSFVIAASYATYINFLHSVTRESTLTSINSDVMTSFKLLERDIKMAGFGLPRAARVASDNNCNVGNEDFCKANADRLFMADGWEILRDFTDNKDDDGNILPTHYSKIADAKYADSYRAQLSSAASSGATSITVNTLNIDSADELDDPDDPNGEDIKDNNAVIIQGPATNNVEGHRVGSIGGLTINFLISDSLQMNYAANSTVVPAIAWYVREDPDGRKYPDGSKMYWLYRNQNRVMPGIEDFQIRYGYDADGDGIQWDDDIPPSFNPDNHVFAFGHLKAIEITLRVKFIDKKEPTKTQIFDHKTIVDLRN